MKKNNNTTTTTTTSTFPTLPISVFDIRNANPDNTSLKGLIARTENRQSRIADLMDAIDTFCKKYDTTLADVIENVNSVAIKNGVDKNDAEFVANCIILAKISVLSVLKAIHRTTGDKMIYKMYLDCINDTFNGKHEDHFQCAFLALWETLKECKGTKYGLTEYLFMEKVTNMVIVSDNLEHTAIKKKYLTNRIKAVYKTIRENIKSYDSYKTLDTTLTCVEIDNEDNFDRNDVSYDTKFYQAVSYNVENYEMYTDYENYLNELEFDDLDKKIIRFLNNNVGAGYVKVANAIYGKEVTNTDKERIKKRLYRLRKDGVNKILKNTKNKELAEHLVNRYAGVYVRESYVPTDDVIIANAMKEVPKVHHDRTFYYLANVADKKFDTVDISVKPNALYHHTGDYKVNLNKNTYNTTNGMFEHAGDLNNVSIATWYFIENHKNAIVIVNR